MVASVPASVDVNVVPSVIGAGGTGLDIAGLILTASTRVPIGQVIGFSTAANVLSYFGIASPEYAMSLIYFAGYDNSSIKPAVLYFTQYPTSAVPAYLRGGNVSGYTLAQLQALSGVLTLTVNGTATTSATINLASATSFSNAATLIQAGFTSPAFAVTYDSIAGAFVFTSTLTGATASMSVATGSLAAPLALTTATGAVTSQGAAIATPAAFMTNVLAATQDFACFTTMFEPVTSDCVAFAAWNNAQGNNYLYVPWDTDVTPTTASDTSSMFYLIKQAGYAGVLPVWSPDASKAVFAMSIPACYDFSKAGDRATFKFRAQAGLTPDVTSPTVYANLIANGYSFYVAEATANNRFSFFTNGAVSGSFLWADSYVCQIQLNNALQLALIKMMQSVKLIPYNSTGYGIIENAMLDPIEAALNFGTIQSGVALTNAQQTEVDAATGVSGSYATVSSRGWVVSIQPSSALARASRTSPPCVFVYADGGSIQQITLQSIEVV